MYRVYVNGTQWDPAISENTDLDISQETGQQFFRNKLTGTLIFRASEAQEIIDAAYGTKWDVEIYTVSAEGSEQLEVVGFFTHTDCDIDLDALTVKAKINTEDEYTDIESKKTEECSLLEELQLADYETLDLSVGTQIYIFIVRLDQGDSYPEESWGFSQFGYVQTFATPGPYSAWLYFAREESFIKPDDSEEWFFLEGQGDDCRQHNGLWVRPYETCSPGLAIYTSTRSGATPHPCGNFGVVKEDYPCDVMNTPGNYWYPPDDECDKWQLLDASLATTANTITCAQWFLLKSDLSGCGYNYQIQHAVRFARVIQILLSKTGTGLTFQEDTDHSEFMYKPGNNPVLDLDEFWEDRTQRLNNLYLIHMKDANQNLEPQDTYTSKISLENVLKWIEVLFNAFYHIDNGRFRIEHLAWYENGRTYDGTKELTRDLTSTIDPRTNLPLSYHQNKITYAKEEMPWRETFAFSHETRSALFFDLTAITYTQDAVDKKRESQRQSSDLDTNIEALFRFGQTFGPEGWVLLCCDENKRVLSEAGVFGDLYQIINGHLSWPSLIPRYHRHGRVMISGNLPWTAYTFKTATRVKTQMVEFVDGENPDPFKQIRTEIGDGDIDSMKIDLKTRSMKVTLKHEQ